MEENPSLPESVTARHTADDIHARRRVKFGLLLADAPSQFLDLSALPRADA